MSTTNRDAASVDGYIGTATVVDGVLAVSWADGSLEVLSPQEREFSEGEAEPWHTFLLWLPDEKAPSHTEIRAPSLSAACSILEGVLVERNIAPVRVTFISRRPTPDDEFGRNRFIRTVGGYAPLAA